MAEQQHRIKLWIDDLIASFTPRRFGFPSKTLFVPGLTFARELFPGLNWRGTTDTGVEPDAEPEVVTTRTRRAAWKWVHLISKSYWFAVIRQILASHWHVIGELQRETIHCRILEDRIHRGLGQQQRYRPRR